jgi:hypothetical protein
MKYNIETLDECTCSKDEVYPGNFGPEWFDNEEEVIKRIIVYEGQYPSGIRRYWALHLNDKHVIKVKQSL